MTHPLPFIFAPDFMIVSYRPKCLFYVLADMGAGGENVKVLSRKQFEQEYGGDVVKTELVMVSVERGLSWEKAMDVWRDHVGSDDGFYISTGVRPLLLFFLYSFKPRKKN